jgi:hypothetical protein
MGITMTATGAFRETGASFFFIPKGALTHHRPKGRRWYPSLRSGRALCEADRALRRAPDNAAEPAGVGRHCLYGWQIGLRPVCSSAANCCPLSGQPAIRLRKPATGSFVAVMDDATPHRPFSFVSAKETKPPHTGAERK